MLDRHPVSTYALTVILEPQGRPVPQDLNIVGRAKFIAWRPRCPFFWGGMPTGPEVFLKPSGVSGLQPCARTHLKKALCYTHPVDGMMGRTTNTDFILAEWSVCTTLGGAGLGHTSVGCVSRYMELVGCVLVPVAVGRRAPWQASSRPRWGASPRL